MTDAQCIEKIQRLKKSFGPRLIIAAHHYQRPEIVALADLVGDSYRMAVEAGRSDAEYIVICGVRFMAESAAILARSGQTVLLPDFNAGCPMAEMIDRPTAEKALDYLSRVAARPVTPIAYMNSGADIKALTGERGGSVCTSGNALKIVKRYLDTGETVFFMPDANLGMNTATALGLASNEVRVVGAKGPLGDDTDSARTRMYLWDGYCPVHRAFTPDDIATARKAAPEAKIIVHPECAPCVAELADATGSTEVMHKALRAASAGSMWAIGTESRFTERMRQEFPDKDIRPLKTSYCQDMNRITLANLAETLEKRSPSVIISERDREYATRALNTMVRIAECE